MISVASSVVVIVAALLFFVLLPPLTPQLGRSLTLALRMVCFLVGVSANVAGLAYGVAAVVAAGRRPHAVLGLVLHGLLMIFLGLHSFVIIV